MLKRDWVKIFSENFHSFVTSFRYRWKISSFRIGKRNRHVLSPFLFVTVLEALSREWRRALPWEVLHADDLVIIAESLEELDTRYAAWKKCMEVKGLRVNLAKAKVMISDVNRGTTFTSRKYPCGVCCKGVGSNSIFCNHFIHWVCNFCTGLNGRLDNVVDFKWW